MKWEEPLVTSSSLSASHQPNMKTVYVSLDRLQPEPSSSTTATRSTSPTPPRRMQTIYVSLDAVRPESSSPPNSARSPSPRTLGAESISSPTLSPRRGGDQMPSSPNVSPRSREALSKSPSLSPRSNEQTPSRLFRLAMKYKKGSGVPKDLHKAKGLFEQVYFRLDRLASEIGKFILHAACWIVYFALLLLFVVVCLLLLLLLLLLFVVVVVCCLLLAFSCFIIVVNLPMQRPQKEVTPRRNFASGSCTHLAKAQIWTL